MGFKPTLKHIQDTYEGDWVEKTAPEPAAPPPNDRSPEFAEGDPRDPADELADNLEARSAAALDKLMEPLKRLVQSASSLEEIRDGLDALYPDMDEIEVAVLLREAFAAAHLAGRFKVDQYRKGAGDQ